MLKNKNIFLIGMMNSGKTTIGEKLSKKLKMDYIDTDQQIEEIMSMSISDIFKIFGEEHFRKMESAFFLEKTKQQGIVFSTGGGIVLSTLNGNCLKNNGITFLLETSIDRLIKRSNNIQKPLLNKSKDIKFNLLKIWEDRKSLYYKYAHHIINNDYLLENETVDKIINILNEKN